MQYADVCVNSGQPARRGFTYRVPAGMRIEPGQPVFVPFGPRILQGIVLGPGEPPEGVEARDIVSVADDEPLLDAAHLHLAAWMSERYLAPLWDCIAVCLPRGYGQKPVTMISPVDLPPLYPPDRVEQRVLRFIGGNGRTPLDTLREVVGQVTIAKLRSMQERGLLTVTEGLARPRGHARFERRVRASRAKPDLLAEARRQREGNARSVAARILDALAGTDDVPLATLRALGAGRDHLDALADGGWLEEYESRVVRDPLIDLNYESKPPPTLSAEQQDAFAYLREHDGPALLFGVTGAGKTEVYLELAREAIESGKGVIVLVPEISLTPQAIRRFAERFGDSVVTWHSGLSDGELFDTWGRIADGDARLVLGSRSALFAPVRDLGLIVIDEEHEPSYKQSDPSPRYHARDAAMELARLSGARLALGSATPDLTTYYRASRGSLGIATLETRLSPGVDGGVSAALLPRVEVIDMREELRWGNRSVFSRALLGAVNSALRAREQAILFVNRRGGARFLLCRECGRVAECPQCQVAMSLSGDDGSLPRLVCHHCGRTQRPDVACPQCGSSAYRPFGSGTQRIELEARRAFPAARVARWDSESASRKGAHEAFIERLESGTVDIVVGTQVLAKGLDLPNLTVVGVVDADVGMHLPAYSAPERAFQLLMQVIGRAGRRDRQGTAVLQTYYPEHPSIRAAATQDYLSFYEDELPHRRRAGYPPFTRLVQLTYRHGNAEHALEEASRVANELRVIRDAAGRADPDVLGPGPAYIRRLRGEYRWHILLRGHEPAALVEKVRLGARWTVDVDPVNLL